VLSRKGSFGLANQRLQPLGHLSTGSLRKGRKNPLRSSGHIFRKNKRGWQAHSLSHREILGEGIASADRRMQNTWLTPCIFGSTCFYHEAIADCGLRAHEYINWPPLWLSHHLVNQTPERPVVEDVPPRASPSSSLLKNSIPRNLQTGCYEFAVDKVHPKTIIIAIVNYDNTKPVSKLRGVLRRGQSVALCQFPPEACQSVPAGCVLSNPWFGPNQVKVGKAKIPNSLINHEPIAIHCAKMGQPDHSFLPPPPIRRLGSNVPQVKPGKTKKHEIAHQTPR
jgi:hypothetical protein